MKYLQNLYDLENPANRQKSPISNGYITVADKKMSLKKRQLNGSVQTYDLLWTIGNYLRELGNKGSLWQIIKLALFNIGAVEGFTTTMQNKIRRKKF